MTWGAVRLPQVRRRLGRALERRVWLRRVLRPRLGRTFATVVIGESTGGATGLVLSILGALSVGGLIGAGLQQGRDRTEKMQATMSDTIAEVL